MLLCFPLLHPSAPPSEGGRRRLSFYCPTHTLFQVCPDAPENVSAFVGTGKKKGVADITATPWF